MFWGNPFSNIDTEIAFCCLETCITNIEPTNSNSVSLNEYIYMKKHCFPTKVVLKGELHQNQIEHVAVLYQNYQHFLKTDIILKQIVWQI